MDPQKLFETLSLLPSSRAQYLINFQITTDLKPPKNNYWQKGSDFSPMLIHEWIMSKENKKQETDFVNNALYLLAHKNSHHNVRSYLLFESSLLDHPDLFFRFSRIFNLLDQYDWERMGHSLVAELKEFHSTQNKEAIAKKIELYIKTNKLNIQSFLRFNPLDETRYSQLSEIDKSKDLNALEKLIQETGVKYFTLGLCQYYSQNEDARFRKAFALYTSQIYFDPLQTFHVLATSLLKKGFKEKEKLWFNLINEMDFQPKKSKLPFRD